MAYAKTRREKISAAQKRSTKGELPDFVVIGTQKGGTTFFYELLSNHPLVRPAVTKELHFFDRNKNFDKGVDWYRRCLPESERVDGQRTVTGESSPSYLFSAQAPARMAEVIPDAKLVALLRNPIDRAYSHYQMQVRRGTEERQVEARHTWRAASTPSNWIASRTSRIGANSWWSRAKTSLHAPWRSCIAY
jgi:hypothetical protein